MALNIDGTPLKPGESVTHNLPEPTPEETAYKPYPDRRFIPGLAPAPGTIEKTENLEATNALLAESVKLFEERLKEEQEARKEEREEHKAEIANLRTVSKNSVNGLVKEIAELKARNAAIEQVNTDLMEELETLREGSSELERVKEELASYKRRIRELIEENKSLKQVINSNPPAENTSAKFMQKITYDWLKAETEVARLAPYVKKLKRKIKSLRATKDYNLKQAKERELALEWRLRALRVKELEEEAKSLREENIRLDSRVISLERVVDMGSTRYQTLQGKYEALEKDLARSRKANDTLAQEVRELRRRNASPEDNALVLKLERETNSALRVELGRLRDELARVKEVVERQAVSHGNMRNRNIDLESKRAILEEENQKLHEKIGELSKLVRSGTETTANKTLTLANLRYENERLAGEIKELRERIASQEESEKVRAFSLQVERNNNQLMRHGLSQIRELLERALAGTNADRDYYQSVAAASKSQSPEPEPEYGPVEICIGYECQHPDACKCPF